MSDLAVELTFTSKAKKKPKSYTQLSEVVCVWAGACGLVWASVRCVALCTCVFMCVCALLFVHTSSELT